jgi:solute carrier family 13 (sodium-dependent dicarboxylate transporter), member 2/3/5
MGNQANSNDTGMAKTDYSRIIKMIVGIALAAIVAYLLPENGNLGSAGRATAFIFVIAVFFWVTEVIPAFATAILVTGLNVFILGKPGFVQFANGAEFATNSKTWNMFTAPFMSTIILIFMGGFFISLAVEKYNLDKIISRAIIKKTGKKPKLLLLMVIMITGLFSMFMSNTATAAMMFALLTPVILKLPAAEAKFKVALGLGVAFGANFGGVGTLIGTPANGLAQGALAKNGVSINFLDWMVVGFPFAIVMLFTVWILLLKMYAPGKDAEIVITDELQDDGQGRQRKMVIAIFLATVFMWVTAQWTKMPTPVAAIFPVVAFTAMGLLNSKDLKRIDWSILALVGGGLSLGVAIKSTGFGAYFLSLLPLESMSPFVITLVLLLSIITLSNFMSNTASAAMFIPIVAAMPGDATILNVIVVAMGASLAMSFPIATPPNTLAYSQGIMSSKDMQKGGTIISLVGIVILVILAELGGILGGSTFAFLYDNTPL